MKSHFCYWGEVVKPHFRYWGGEVVKSHFRYWGEVVKSHFRYGGLHFLKLPPHPTPHRGFKFFWAVHDISRTLDFLTP